MDRREQGGVAARADDFRIDAAEFPPMHDQKRPEIGMLVYPGLTLMDMLGPQTALSTSANVHLLWKTRDLIRSDTGIELRPTATFADCPRELDALFVGGGPGQIGLMDNPETLGFLASRGSRAGYVTSVCSGSLLLGAAGLLRGYKATSHWSCRDALALFGATPVDARVVTDRNRVTGGGVTAGLDFGLVLLAKMLGEEIARMTQLAIEYDPEPPFRAGTPGTAGPEITQRVRDWMRPFDGLMREACERASRAMPGD